MTSAAWRSVGSAFTIAGVTLALLLVWSSAASSDEWGVVSGTVVGPSGAPALGACVTQGESALPIDGDGTFEFDATPDRPYTLFFYSCSVPEEVYPYEARYWRNATDQSNATRITVAPGERVSVRMVLPLKAGGPARLGAVTGDLIGLDDQSAGYRKVDLINEDGDAYWAFVRDGSYTAAAPPGGYRVLTSKYHAERDYDYLPVFYGQHPRGFAASWEEAEVVTIGAPGQVVRDADIVVPTGKSQLDDESVAGTRLSAGGSFPDDLAQVEVILSDSAPFGRVGIRTIGDPPHALEDIEAWAFPRLSDWTQEPATIRIHESVATGLQAGEVAVWSGHQSVPDCDIGTTEVCVESRTAEDFYGNNVITISINHNRGAIFRFGDRPQFYDSEGSLFAGSILWLADSGITKGCNPPANDLFCPGDYVTRGQMAAFLVRALGLTDRGGVGFSDDDGSIFEADIERLATAGITKGCNPPDNDRYCPHAAVTRGQMAAFLNRALDDL